MTALFLFLIFFTLLILGVPVAVSLGLASIIHVVLFSSDSMSSIALKLFEASEHYTLLAIPFFILASRIMTTGGVAKRIIRFSIAVCGHVRGGMAVASVFACMMFAALSGSSAATVVAIGSISIAAMRQVGYSRDFAAGVICNAGTLGILIPPSIVMVVYAAATDVSVGRMFLAGVIPGFVAGGMLMIAIYVLARIRGFPRQKWAGWGEIVSSAIDASWGMALIVIILGGIYGGIFTPTEAAAVSAVYAFLVVNLVYRDAGPLVGKPWIGLGGGNLPVLMACNLILIGKGLVLSLFHRDTHRALSEAGQTTVMLMFVIVNALLFAHVLTTERIPQDITEWMVGIGLEWWSFLIIVNLLLLLGGQFMEPSGLLLIVAPLVFPIAIRLGIDPIHLGIIMVVNMEIGLVTPPVGLNLFVTSAITGMTVVETIRAAMPWVLVLLAFLVLITYIPIISTLLPTALMGPEIITTR